MERTTPHTDQYTKRLSCINLHDHTQLGVGVINMERATQDGYITHRSIHEMIIMRQPSWSYASSITQSFGVGVINMERTTQDGYITHRSKHKKIIMHQNSWSYAYMIIRASRITQPSWRWERATQDGYITHRLSSSIIMAKKMVTTQDVVHHKELRNDYHASTFMIIRIKHNPIILALELSTWKELHKMVTSHTDQNTKRLSCIKIHDHTHQA